jgi:hypothetical protein
MICPLKFTCCLTQSDYRERLTLSKATAHPIGARRSKGEFFETVARSAHELQFGRVQMGQFGTNHRATDQSDDNRKRDQDPVQTEIEHEREPAKSALNALHVLSLPLKFGARQG